MVKISISWHFVSPSSVQCCTRSTDQTTSLSLSCSQWTHLCRMSCQQLSNLAAITSWLKWTRQEVRLILRADIYFIQIARSCKTVRNRAFRVINAVSMPAWVMFIDFLPSVVSSLCWKLVSDVLNRAQNELSSSWMPLQSTQPWDSTRNCSSAQAAKWNNWWGWGCPPYTFVFWHNESINAITSDIFILVHAAEFGSKPRKQSISAYIFSS